MNKALKEQKKPQNIANNFHIPEFMLYDDLSGRYKKKNIYNESGQRNRYIRKTFHNGQKDPKTGRKIQEQRVKPIKDKDKLNRFVFILKNNRETPWVGARDALAFKLGTLTGLRVSDVLAFRKEDVFDRKEIYVTEQKTKKHRTIYVDNIIPDIEEYRDLLPSYQKNEYLFPSSQSFDHMQYATFYQALNSPAFAAGLKNIGTHSMRKTFGYNFYKATISDPKILTLPTLMDIFNHSSEKMTIKYIGLEEKQITEAVRTINPFE